MLVFVSKSTAQEVFWGDSVSIGQGIARTYIEIDGNSAPLEIGVVLTAGALGGLPNTSRMFSLELPQVTSDSLFKHVLFDWNPHGHPPDVYLDPHFDFHFYTVTEAQRMQISEGIDSIPVLPQFIPPDYVADGGSSPYAVGDMGVHYLDELAPEFNGGAFGHTLIYGFYQGLMYFVEPMITLEYLQSNSDSSFTIRQPERYQHGGYYPTQYTIAYDDTLELYNIRIHDFVLQASTNVDPEMQPSRPLNYLLLKSFPNPFNPSTTIEYDVPKAGHISLRVFDLTGSEVAILREGEIQAGRHRAVFDGRDLASGIYFTRLEVNGFSQSVKLILVK